MSKNPATLARIRVRARVRFFPVCGVGGNRRLERLSRAPTLQPVTTPRHARVLVVTGRIPVSAYDPLARVHDQLPHPRASLCWGERPDVLAAAERAEGEAVPVEHLHRLQRELERGTRASAAALLPDQPPMPWRGRGEHGQGGDGMMGGYPYGRPMSMTGDDPRDGLALDAHSTTIGPFAPMLPPGLCLRFTLQGDVVANATVVTGPFADPAALAAFRPALRRAVSPRTLERARAVHHLRCVARFLEVRGTRHWAAVVRRAVDQVERGGAPDPGRLDRLLRWSGVWLGIAPGLGRLAGRHGLAGPALRACGIGEDLRAAQPPYRDAGFLPVTEAAGDVRARVRQWLREATQALALCHRLTDAPLEPGAVEGPAGPFGPGVAPAPPLGRDAANRLLQGLEWTQAVSVLASFDANTLARLLAEAPA